MPKADISLELWFLKLGGSLITEKSKPFTPRLEVLTRLAQEIHLVRKENPQLRLLIGHGSGSFGHTVAQKYATRQGVHTTQEWQGFAEVGHSAANLHYLVMQAFHRAGLPAISFPPSACVIAEQGRVADWPLEPVRSALVRGLVPVVFGDVAFDRALGGTVLSTEDLFIYLNHHLQPQNILFAGRESGVWVDYPKCTRLIEEIRLEDASWRQNGVSSSAAMDVTGGMLGKVEACLQLVRQNPGLRVRIFSAEEPAALLQAFSGVALGTLVRA